jgi:hypothetical protein
MFGWMLDIYWEARCRHFDGWFPTYPLLVLEGDSRTRDGSPPIMLIDTAMN